MEYLKQSSSTALYPDLLWEKPENKQQAGKILLIGGNLHAMAKIAEAAAICTKSGAGAVRTILPECVKKLVGIREDIFYAQSNQSGGFARQSLDAWLEHAIWADMVLLPGELGRNSESAQVLESFISKYSGPLVITRDALDLLPTNHPIVDRPQTVLVATLPQLQRLFAEQGVYIKQEMPLQKMVEILGSLPSRAYFITFAHNNLLVVADQMASITSTELESWRLPIACRSAVWYMQFPKKHFEALTTASYSAKPTTTI